MKDFLGNESGAVTVDWTVLTSALVGLAIAVLAATGPGLVALGQRIADAVAGAPVLPQADDQADDQAAEALPTPQELRNAFRDSDLAACAGGMEGVFAFGRASVDAGIGHFDNYADSDAHVTGWLGASDQAVRNGVAEHQRWAGENFSDDELIQFAAAHCLAAERGL